MESHVRKIETTINITSETVDSVSIVYIQLSAPTDELLFTSLKSVDICLVIFNGHSAAAESCFSLRIRPSVHVTHQALQMLCDS